MSTAGAVAAASGILGVVTGGLGLILMGTLSYAICLGSSTGVSTSGLIKPGRPGLRPRPGGGVTKPTKPQGRLRGPAKPKTNSLGQALKGTWVNYTNSNASPMAYTI